MLKPGDGWKIVAMSAPVVFLLGVVIVRFLFGGTWLVSAGVGIVFTVVGSIATLRVTSQFTQSPPSQE